MNEELNTNQPEPPKPPAYSYPAAEPKPEIVYTRTERICAVVLLIAGILFVRLGMYHTAGLLTTFLSWGITLTQIVMLKKGGHTFSVTDKIWIAVLLVFGCAYTVTSNTLLKALSTIFLVMGGNLFCFYKTRPAGVMRFLPVSLFSAVFALSFAHCGNAFGAAARSVKQNGNARRIGQILLGLLIAVPLTLVVGCLLCSSDDHLKQILMQFINFDFDEFAPWVPHTIIGLILGMLLFSVPYTAAHREHGLNAEECGRTVLGMRFLPNLIAYTAVTPICLLYILYAFSQMQYFLGGFTGETGSMTYSEYARRGFFELCAVCVINLAVISCIGFFARTTGREKPLLLRLYSVFLSACSLFLAGTALAKMFLYIRFYGMTPLRVYTTWFMLLLVIGFMALIVRQFRYGLNLGKIAVIAFTVMFALLVFSRPDAWMIRWNADHYLTGQLHEFDTEILYEVSDDGLAALTAYDTGEIRRLSGTEESLDHKLYEREKEMDFYEHTSLSAWILMLWKQGAMRT